MDQQPDGLLFRPGRIGRLALPNRIVRSATAERLADDDGVPGPALGGLYLRLVEGGVGLIVTGHAYVGRQGRCHPEMTGADRDEMIPHLARLADAAHAAGGRIALQINHGGAACDPAVTPERIAPSGRPLDGDGGGCRPPAREEIPGIVESYARAARRAKLAGFDAVQVHGAHGYLVSQFLSPLTNRRDDEWGGGLGGRMRFLREVGRAIRSEVGPGYPLLVKLGVRDYREGGLSLEEGLEVVASLAEMGFDGVEVSHGIGGPGKPARRQGASPAEREARLLEVARRARAATGLPVILVNGLRSRAAMEEVLASGAADYVSLCRPLIREPDLPARFRSGAQDIAACRSCDRCWPTGLGEGVACRHPSRGRMEKNGAAGRPVR